MTDNKTTEQDVQRRLKTFKESEYVSDRNGELVEKFIDELKSNNQTGNWRRKMYISKFSVSLEKYINKEEYEETDFDRLTKMDMVKLIGDLGEDMADRTLNAYKSCFRMFYKQRYPLKEDRPKRVKKIFQSGILKHDSKPKDVVNKNFFTPEQIWRMVEVANNPRDACLPIMAFDSGARTTELSSVTLRDISLTSGCAEVVFIDCKNGKEARELPLTHCIEKLRNWLEHHPRKDENDAPLWCKIRDYGDREKGEKLSNKSLNDIVKKLSRRAKEKYPEEFSCLEPTSVTIYDFRHSSIDFRKIHKNYGANRLMWWYAWKLPDMAGHYGEDDNTRYKNAVKQEEGIETKDKEFSHSMQRKECPRCEKERSPDAKYCPECSIPIETETAMKDSALREAGRKLVEMKLDDKIADKEIKEIVEEVKNR